MIFRAVTALAVACMVLPKEPNLGLDRPAGARDPISVVIGAICDAGTSGLCAATKLQKGTDLTGRSLLERLRQVKIDIEQDERRRAAD